MARAPRVLLSATSSRQKPPAFLSSKIAKTPQPPFKSFHTRHYDFRVVRAHGQTNPSRLRRQTAAQFFPSRPGICALENSAHIFAAGRVRSRSKTPGRSLSRVKRGVNDLRITRIENQIAATGA